MHITVQGLMDQAREFAASLANWRQENPKGRHRADPAFFGLDSEVIKGRFESYSRRFGARM